MVVSAIYLMDSKGKILINRNYRGDVSKVNADKFVLADERTGFV